MKSLFRKIILFLSIGFLVIGGIYLGNQWIQKRRFQQEVLSAIQEPNNLERIKLVADLRDTKPDETLGILMGTMESSDPALRRQAARALVFFRDHLADHTNVLAKHLRADSDPRVRLGCAILLMSVRSSEVDQAYIQALQDTEEKVVEIALAELGQHKNAASDSAVFATLHHPSWRVRLEACKSLITSDAADDRVVSALEAMKQEPEARVYDAESAEFDRINRETASAGDPPIAYWGNLESILNQARSVNAKHHQ